MRHAIKRLIWFIFNEFLNRHVCKKVTKGRVMFTKMKMDKNKTQITHMKIFEILITHIYCTKFNYEGIFSVFRSLYVSFVGTGDSL